MQTLPAHVDSPKNRKQKLRNDILDLFDQNSMVFKHTEVTSVGEQIVQTLTNTLWYVDGHHEVLKSRACEVSTVFNAFVGSEVHRPSSSKRRQKQNTLYTICS